jgi:predicted O-methyltransferase YrrM
MEVVMISLRQFATTLIPECCKQKIRGYRDVGHLKRFRSHSCDLTNLRSQSTINVNQLLDPSKFESEWERLTHSIAQFSIPEKARTINSGDRKALYYLVRGLKPKAALEVGTHIGISTIHIAAALRSCEIEDNQIRELTTVDIRDVNSTSNMPWKEYGMVHSPLQMIKELGFEGFVKFVTSRSVDYAAGCNRKFDFVFLDGDHAAATVYAEIPLMLKLLNNGGVIVLHDYFPDGKPLWSNKSAVEGPFLAVKRFRDEGTSLSVLPLGSLPWPTKLNSNITSLALLAKD